MNSVLLFCYLMGRQDRLSLSQTDPPGLLPDFGTLLLPAIGDRVESVVCEVNVDGNGEFSDTDGTDRADSIVGDLPKKRLTRLSHKDPSWREEPASAGAFPATRGPRGICAF